MHALAAAVEHLCLVFTLRKAHGQAVGDAREAVMSCGKGGGGDGTKALAFSLALHIYV